MQTDCHHFIRLSISIRSFLGGGDVFVDKKEDKLGKRLYLRLTNGEIIDGIRCFARMYSLK